MKLSKDIIENLLPIRYIHRDIHSDLFNHVVNRKEVTILYGPRQVGKSSETLKIISDLMKIEKKSDFFYYNLDNIYKDFKDPDYFINLINIQKTDKDYKCYILIDEAQRLKDIGLFVKYIYDKKLNFKILLTGSASLDIKESVKEPLTGRKKEFYLNSLTLKEILQFKGFDPAKITGYFTELGDVLDEYLIWGGYPEVVLETIIERKREKLLEIAHSYIFRDMANLFGIDNNDLIRMVSVFTAENIGNLYSTNGASKFLSISRNEVSKVINALEKVFIIKLIPTFTKQKIKELVHSKKIYFYDPGIRNALLDRLEDILLLTDKGRLFENTVCSHLMVKYDREKIKFWRTQNQTEIDFIVHNSISDIEAYEVKYRYENKGYPRNMHSFIDSYKSLITKEAVIHKKNYWEYIF